MSDSDKYHELAKDAGNRLRAYILSVSSGATGVFFFALTGPNASPVLTIADKTLLLISLIGFVSTVTLCLYELRIDAQRFFYLAKQLEKPAPERSWAENEKFKQKRYLLIHASYVTLGIAIATTFIYLVLNIVST